MESKCLVEKHEGKLRKQGRESGRLKGGGREGVEEEKTNGRREGNTFLWSDIYIYIYKIYIIFVTYIYIYI